MRTASLAVIMAVLVSLMGCKKAGPAPAPPGIMPPVRAFLQETDHGFGRPILTGDAPPWAKGPRQVVSFDTGRSLLFYIEGEKVVSVYEEGAAGRSKVWGE